MDSSDLERIGLNRNEAKVFLALLNSGPAIASELVKITGFHRNIIYDNLDKLVERGLVTYINEDGKRRFAIAPPEAMNAMLERDFSELESRKAVVSALVPKMSAELAKSRQKQSAMIYRGAKSFKGLLREVINSGSYLGMGVSNASTEILGADFWNNFIMQVKKNKVRERLLLNSDFKLASLPIASPRHTQLRFLPSAANMVTEILIYSDKVAIMVYSDPPIATVIQDEFARDSFTEYFEHLWAISRPVK
jgi:sugar-specific transcriptional regulator TrmB